MKIAQHTVVELCYELEVEGQIVDRTTKEKPLDFIQGTGSLLNKFEENIEESFQESPQQQIQQQSSQIFNEALLEKIIENAANKAVEKVIEKLPKKDNENPF